MTLNGRVVGGQVVGGHTIVMVLVEGVQRVKMDTEAVLTLAESAPPAEPKECWHSVLNGVCLKCKAKVEGINVPAAPADAPCATCGDGLFTGSTTLGTLRPCPDCMPGDAPTPAEQEVGRCVAAGAPTTPGRCFKCGRMVEPSPCHCGKSHTGTYCWPCHHKNVQSCAAPHCPEHGFLAAQKWMAENAEEPSE